MFFQKAKSATKSTQKRRVIQYRGRDLNLYIIAPLCVVVLALSACEKTPTVSPTITKQVSETLSAEAKLGALIFSDTRLSASGAMSCATCHDPSNAHAPNNALSVQLGGAKHDVPGFRATPSLRYLHFTPGFSIDAEGKASGGFTWDGRAASLARQAERPFLAPHEMANQSKADVVAKLAQANYAEKFKTVYGATIFSTPELAFEKILLSLERFQIEEPSFHPFDSKYDAYLKSQIKLSAAEARGEALFNDANKANCAACHVNEKSANGRPPLFTDFTYDNLGVPRNADIPATRDPKYVDLGLCGPDRLDLKEKTELCGAFKVPTLRNVATRKVFFHNGKVKSLKDAVSFYVRRDTHPEEWYPKNAQGKIDKFNDLPRAFHTNVNVKEVPYDRKPGMAPALNEAEVDDVVAFLQTLSDGYKR